MDNVLPSQSEDAMRRFFHWQFSGVLIPVFWGSALAMVGIAVSQDSQDIIHTFFLFAYISFVCAFFWAAMYWITSDFLLEIRSDVQRHRVWKFIILFIIIDIFILFMGITFRMERIRTLSTFTGDLTPANDKDIPACRNRLPTDFLLFVGNDLVLSVKAWPFTILSIDGVPVLSLFKKDNGEIGITAKVYNKDGKLIADVVKGAFDVNRRLIFRMERPDFHTLKVINDEGSLALFIRYNNKSEMTVLTDLYYPGVGHVDVISRMQKMCVLFAPGTSFMDYSTKPKHH